MLDKESVSECTRKTGAQSPFSLAFRRKLLRSQEHPETYSQGRQFRIGKARPVFELAAGKCSAVSLPLFLDLQRAMRLLSEQCYHNSVWQGQIPWRSWLWEGGEASRWGYR
jgi:hypothetical protein